MHRLLVLLALLLAVGLSACGAAEEAGPGGSTESSEPPTPALSDTAQVVCVSGEAPRIETPAVKPQADGVHVEFVNDTDKELSTLIEHPEDGGMGMSAPKGSSSQVVDLGPGTFSVTCYDGFTEDGSEVPRSSIEVVDEDGIWVSTRLGCNEQFSQVLDYIQGASGETTDPLEAARKGVEGFSIEPDDVFERAGYPETDTVRVRAVRDGEPIMVVDLIDDGTGKWLVSQVTGCSSLEN
jgi:hypothetical protein